MDVCFRARKLGWLRRKSRRFQEHSNSMTCEKQFARHNKYILLLSTLNVLFGFSSKLRWLIILHDYLCRHSTKNKLCFDVWRTFSVYCKQLGVRRGRITWWTVEVDTIKKQLCFTRKSNHQYLSLKLPLPTVMYIFSVLFNNSSAIL
jgi:hypothetical protein